MQYQEWHKVRFIIQETLYCSMLYLYGQLWFYWQVFNDQSGICHYLNSVNLDITQSSNWVSFETESHFSLALTLKRLERKCTWWHEDSTPKLTKSCIYTQFSVVLFEDAWCMICNSSELIPPWPLLWTTLVSKFSALSPRVFQNSKNSI